MPNTAVERRGPEARPRSTGDALRRRYFELVLVEGRNIVVFHDLMQGRWYLQQG